MKRSAFLIPITILALLLINTTSGADQPSANKKKSDQPKIEQINVCSGGRCIPLEKAYSPQVLLDQFQQLFTANDGEKVNFCKADDNTQDCTIGKVCHFVLGGIIPGNGCSEGISFHTAELNLQASGITMKADMPLTFIGTPLVCKTADSTISILSPKEIILELKPHFCSWMAVGAMSAKFNLAVDRIDLDRGEIGGYWKHSVKGTGIGSGSGYLRLQFPKNIVWQALNPTTAEQALQSGL